MTKVLLLTPFHPNIGGGGVNIRTLIAGFQKIEVDWRYRGLDDDPTCLGDSSIKGSTLGRYWSYWQIFRGGLTPPLKSAVERLAALRADVYWLVIHEEFLPLAVHLRRRVGNRIHVSIQDDPPDAIYARSRRFRHVRFIARNHQKRHLPTFPSIDVTSSNMRTFYQNVYGVDSTVVHPVVRDPQLADTYDLPGDELRIGHIGSLYTSYEWRAFLAGADAQAKRLGRRLVLRIIGNPGSDITPPPGFAGRLEMLGQMDENAAVAELGRCHLLYAMYPFSPPYRVFRETSQPTKLTTYVRAARPIFGHSPEGSSLEAFLDRYAVGKNCPSLRQDEVADSIERLLLNPPERERYTHTLEQEFGPDNAVRLENMLLQLAGR